MLLFFKERRERFALGKERIASSLLRSQKNDWFAWKTNKAIPTLQILQDGKSEFSKFLKRIPVYALYDRVEWF